MPAWSASGAGDPERRGKSPALGSASPGAPNSSKVAPNVAPTTWATGHGRALRRFQVLSQVPALGEISVRPTIPPVPAAAAVASPAGPDALAEADLT